MRKMIIIGLMSILLLAVITSAGDTKTDVLAALQASKLNPVKLPKYTIIGTMCYLDYVTGNVKYCKTCYKIPIEKPTQLEMINPYHQYCVRTKENEDATAKINADLARRTQPVFSYAK